MAKITDGSLRQYEVILKSGERVKISVDLSKTKGNPLEAMIEDMRIKRLPGLQGVWINKIEGDIEQMVVVSEIAAVVRIT